MEEVSPQPNRTEPQGSEKSPQQLERNKRLKQWEDLTIAEGVSLGYMVKKDLEKVFDLREEMTIYEYDYEIKNIKKGDGSALLDGVGQYNLATALDISQQLVELFKTPQIYTGTSYYIPLTTPTLATGLHDETERAWIVLKKQSSSSVLISLVTTYLARSILDKDSYLDYLVEEK